MDQIKLELSLAESMLGAFKTKHTASSATRCRAHLLKLTKLCNELRKQILTESKEHKQTRASKKNVVPPEEQTEPVEPTVEPVEPVDGEVVKKPRKQRKSKVV